MRQISLSILVCLMVTACGTKGPLYIPEQQYPQDAQPKDVEQKSAPQK
ncbi:MAG: lipoprotein [Nitrosomonadales bacterium]|nr:lipoprotein [Nitrosomonadales bacterium]